MSHNMINRINDEALKRFRDMPAKDFAIRFAGRYVDLGLYTAMVRTRGFIGGYLERENTVLVSRVGAREVGPNLGIVGVVAVPLHGHLFVVERLLDRWQEIIGAPIEVAPLPGLGGDSSPSGPGDRFPHSCPCGCGAPCYVGLGAPEYPSGTVCRRG